MDWEELSVKRTEPPWVPRLRDETDTSNFDAVFTSEDVNASGVDGGASASGSAAVTSESLVEGFQGLGDFVRDPLDLTGRTLTEEASSTAGGSTATASASASSTHQDLQMLS